MVIDKQVRFTDSDRYFCCPVCQEPLSREDNSLKCPNKHTYDLSKFGYVNLLGGKKVSEHYDKESFENRKLVLEHGFYDHILLGVQAILEEYPQLMTLLDIGCGEGYYARKLLEATDKTVLAFDISKDSVQLAAKSDQTRRGKWFVGDLARLPLQDGCIDGILDIFSPANYAEFHRVLSEHGLVIKVIPTAKHLQEIRDKAKEQLADETYSNAKVLQHFQEHFELVRQVEVTAILPCDEGERQAFLAMTPLLFHVDQTQIDWSDMTKLTVSAEILVGKRKK